MKKILIMFIAILAMYSINAQNIDTAIYNKLSDAAKKEIQAAQISTNLEQQMQPARRRISPARIDSFGNKLRARLLSDTVAARKAWLQCFIKEVRIGSDRIDIIGAER